MPENAYLKSLRAQYEAHEKSIAGLEARAVEAKRDLTNEEMRSIVEMGEKNKSLYTQIEDLSEIELRNAKVSAMAARVNDAIAGAKAQEPDDGQPDGGPDDGTQFRKLGGAKTQDRDPGFYTSTSKNSFVVDQYRAAKLGDTAAKDRLTQHSNALRDNVHLRDVLGTAGGGGTGLVPPVWLAEQFAPVLHRRLRVAAMLRRVPWSGPFPWTIPIAGTASTNTVVAEGNNPTETLPTYTTITVTPITISGYAEVSRQLLDAANPAVDAVIWGDLLGDFYDQAETQVITAIEGTANINLTTAADGGIATNARNAVLDAIAAISDNGGGDPDIFFARQSRWTSYLKLTDTTNRPLVVPTQSYNPMNAVGLGNLAQGFRSPVQGTLETLEAVTSPTVLATRAYAANSQELLFSLSNPDQFSFEQPAGPSLIRVGVWGYMAFTAGRRPKAIARIAYTTG